MEPPRFQQEDNQNSNKKIPTAEELISLYESRGGLDQHSAAIKAIGDLQSALVRFAAASKRDRQNADSSRKIDSLAAKIAVLDSKLDSKPGLAEALAVGVAAGIASNGVASVLPHLAAFAGEAWCAARSLFKQ